MKKKGISLIVLVITVVVIVILATAVLVNVIQTNIIDAGKEAKFLSDYTSVKEAVMLQAFDEVASTGKIKGITYPVAEMVSSYEKDEIIEKIPTLATTILTLNPGKTLDEVELYYIDAEEISLAEQIKEKRPSGYLIDIASGQIYDYAGEYFYEKRWHVPEEGYDKNEAIDTEEEEDEIWDGWIKLTLYYPDGATNKMWRLHEEGQVRGLPDNQYDTWVDYTGSITIPLARVQDVYIKYTLDGKEVVVPPEGILAVDINVEPETKSTKSVTVKINYDTRAEVKEYKIGNTGWQEYTGPFEVTENVMIEARATAEEKIYDSEGNLQEVKNIAGKDAYRITNITKEVVDMPVDPALAAPTIEYVDTVSDNELARLKITYPEVASKSVYYITGESEKTYTQEVSVTKGDVYVSAYYYTAEGKVSQYARVYIKDKDNVYPPTYGPGPEGYPPTKPGGPGTPLDKTLIAPTLQVLSPANADEVARVKITYPTVAENKLYKINYGKENTYTEEISIKKGGKLVTAYYYTSDNRLSPYNSVYIGGDGNPGPLPGSGGYPQPDDPPIPTEPPVPEMTIPAPTIVHTPTDVTTSVDVTLADVPVDAQGVYIKVGLGNFEKYTGKVTLTSNQNVYGYYIDKDGYRSNTAAKRISNIRLDSKLPYVAINATPDTVVSNKKIESVEVTISSKDATNVEYSFDGVMYTPYASAFRVTRNCTVYARATNEYGVSEDYIYVTNIGEEPPQQVKQLMVSILANPEPSLARAKTDEVEITINYDSKATKKYYRIGTGEAKEYTESFKITENCVVYAYATRTDANGVTTMKGEAKKVIDNLSTGLSEPIITANPDNGNTTDSTRVTIKYDMNATSKKYKINDGAEVNYTTPFEVTENCKITAIAKDDLGNEKIAIYNVTNIVKPTIVTIDKGSYYMIKLNYPAIASNREYKYKEDGQWKEYKDEGFILVKPEYKDELLNAKGELIVKIEDENGDKVKYQGDVYLLDGPISEVFENIFMRWDRSKPDAPIITPSTTDPTRSLYIAIQYSDKLEKKQYKISYEDGKTTEWMPYKGLIEVKENNTVIYARGQDSAEVWTDISSYVVKNIDTIQPEIELQADFEKLTNCLKVKIDAKDLYGIKNVKYASGVLGSSAFKTSGTAISNGATIDITQKGYYTFYAMDNAGNEQVVTVNITNIDIVAPNIKITTNYVDGLNAKVTISYEDAITKEYKIGTNGTWQTYENEITVNSYDVINQNLFNNDYTVTIYARGIDDAGNQGESESIIDKIDLELPEAPVILNKGGAYPTLTQNGVVLDGAVSITYPENVKKMYSLDGENWKEYEGEFESNASVIYAKSVKNSGLEKVVSAKKTGLASDALGLNAYDGKTNTVVDVYPKTPKKLYISKEMQGKKMYVVANGANGSQVIIKSYDENGTSTNVYSANKISQNITIPSDSEYIEFCSNYADFGCDIQEVNISDEPVINDTKYYPVLTENGVVHGYNEVEISYFQTSVQKLYRIGTDGEWQNYTGKVRVEIGQTIYAKGIDKNGNETRIISEYKAELPSDALGANAYDNNTTTVVDVYPKTPKKLYISKEMLGKNMYIVATGANGSQVIIKSCDKNGTITDVYSANKISQNIAIPLDSEYIEFRSTYADFGCDIKEVSSGT